jgi:hypothetical protein
MYEANITVQSIISYKWLTDHNFMVHPRRHSLYFQDENILVFIPVIEKKEKIFTTRLDNVVAMKLEAVPVGFPVPHPLRSSGKDGSPTVVTGDLHRDPTQFTEAMRRIWDWQWLHTLWASLRASQLRATATTTKTRRKPEKRRKKKKTRFFQSDQSSSASEPISGVTASVEPETHLSPKPIPRPRLLDLFSGTGSNAETFKEHGFEDI